MKNLKLIIFGILVIAVAMASVNCSSTGKQRPVPGGEAPDFTLASLGGETVSLSDYRGSPVLLNFWASWCGPCRYEMPYLQEVFEDPEWKAAGLKILAVNLGESPSVAGEFMEGNGFTFMVLLDRTGEVSNTYNIRSIPATFFIDERGIIRYSDVGAFTSKEHIETRLDALISGEE